MGELRDVGRRLHLLLIALWEARLECAAEFDRGWLDGDRQREGDLVRAKEALDLRDAHAGRVLSVSCTHDEWDAARRLALDVLTGDLEPELALEWLSSEGFPGAYPEKGS